MDKSVLKQVMKEQQELVEQFPIQERPAYIVDGFLNYAFVGVRREMCVSAVTASRDYTLNYISTNSYEVI